MSLEGVSVYAITVKFEIPHLAYFNPFFSNFFVPNNQVKDKVKKIKIYINYK
jgi:hypothetical protein